jgi:hypothetical protein
MGNTENCTKCPGNYVCIICYQYYCSDHIVSHKCFNSKSCKLCPQQYIDQCKKCHFNYCDDHISLHNPCITNCKSCIYAISYCHKCNIRIAKFGS